MLVLLLGVALVGLTLLALKLAGAAVAAVAAVLALNGCVIVLVLLRRPARDEGAPADDFAPWRPTSFKRMPEPAADEPAADEHSPQLTVRRQ